MTACIRVLDGRLGGSRVHLQIGTRAFPIKGPRELAAVLDHFRLIELWDNDLPSLAHREMIHLRSGTVTTTPGEIRIWVDTRYYKDTFTAADARAAADAAADLLNPDPEPPLAPVPDLEPALSEWTPR